VTTAALALRRPTRLPHLHQSTLLGVAAAAAAVWVGLEATGSLHDFAYKGVPVLLIPIALWLFLSERYEVTLAVLLVYLGLADGVVKLASGSSVATLGRDLLLYAIALGAVARMIMRRDAIRFPPFTGLVLLWILVCVIQLANPVNSSEVHAVVGLRQHLEFVPLFFLGYLVIRSPGRLSGLLVLLIVIAAANGVASLVEMGIGPVGVAAWSPGYARLVHGTGAQTGAVFTTVTGQIQLRPPGLGDAYGVGGVVGLIALPGGVALLSSRALRPGRRWLLAPLVLLTTIAIVTSQARSDVVGGVVALIAFLALTFTSRRGLAALALTVLVGGVGYLVLTTFTSSHANRYSTIAPSKVVGTAIGARQQTVALIPTYAMRYPLGAGIGSVGPAGGSNIGGGPSQVGAHLDAESEFTFLLIETGLPGLGVMLCFTVAVLAVGLRLRRVTDPRVQRPLAAVTAVWAAMTILWFFGAVTANSPASPFLWVTAGAIAYWYREVKAGRVAVRSRRVGKALALR
jgi:hypothetical protein